MMNRKAKGGDGLRLKKANETLKKVLSDLFMEYSFHHPILEKRLHIISEVRLSKDLKHAMVLMTPLSVVSNNDLLSALNKFKKDYESLLFKKMHTKYAVQLRFVLDTRMDEASGVLKVIDSFQPFDSTDSDSD